MQKTKIGWTDYSVNPIRAVYHGKPGWACTKISPGCAHCYSETLNQRWGTKLPYKDAANQDVDWTLHEKDLDAIVRLKDPSKIFVGDMTDLFHARVPNEWLDQIFSVFASCPAHVFQILTKRADRMFQYLTEIRHRLPPAGQGRCTGGPPFCRSIKTDGCDHTVGFCGAPWPLPNVWVGVSCENQRLANERIPYLQQTPAAVRFLSIEPILGEIDLNRGGFTLLRSIQSPCGKKYAGMDWVIIGGETGSGFRPMKLEWLESLVGQCQATGVKVWVKQDSALRPGQQGRIPDQLWIQEFPHIQGATSEVDVL
jgi:protein gp37